MLLELVTFAWDVCANFNPIRKAYAGYLPQGRIRFLGGGCTNDSANTSFLRSTILMKTSLLIRIEDVLKSGRLALHFL